MSPRPLGKAALLAFAVVAALVLAGCDSGSSSVSSTPSTEAAPPAEAPKGLHVSGNRLLDASGDVVHLRGVNRSGTEYACMQGWGIFDGPNDAASVRAMASWHVNFVRVPLNEDCWLGINGVKKRYAGPVYRSAIVDYVRLLHRFGMYAEVSLMWAAPGKYPATYQAGGPDADHAPAVWAGMAKAFADDPNVILAPWGETVVDPECFLEGGVCAATFGPNDEPYRIAGMQQAVDVMRKAGYRGVIAVPGVNFANDLSGWLAHAPDDPLGQVVAEAHVYGKNVCGSTDCFDKTLAPVAERVPLILGETGEVYDASTCGAKHVSEILRWADEHDVGYAVWAWDAWDTCLSLVKDYEGAPTDEYGSWVKSYLALQADTTGRLGP
ncbi:MAG TPA: cellulase family glycosylhydrolase [Gaiellaceae bacterium]|nr:cellulase family glycosylhydrolase [Gaiellaceae bacterium]